MKHFLREKARIVTSVFTPLLWIFVFGASLAGNVQFEGGGASYQQFMFPGIVGMTVLFGSIFYGVSIIWDRQFGFLKEILVAPVPRVALFAGKVAGGVTIAIIQGTIVLLSAFLIGVNLTLAAFLLSFVFMAITAAVIVSMGLIVGSRLSSFESFNMVMSFLVLPMFLFSGALYPLKNLPAYVQVVTFIDPLTYAVDGMRGAMLGESALPITLDLAVLLAFAAALAFFGQGIFRKLQ